VGGGTVWIERERKQQMIQPGGDLVMINERGHLTGSDWDQLLQGKGSSYQGSGKTLFWVPVTMAREGKTEENTQSKRANHWGNKKCADRRRQKGDLGSESHRELLQKKLRIRKTEPGEGRGNLTGRLKMGGKVRGQNKRKK